MIVGAGGSVIFSTLYILSAFSPLLFSLYALIVQFFSTLNSPV